MTLLSLPNELLLQISTEQSLPEINALLRTNRRLAILLRHALLEKLIHMGPSEYAKRALHHLGERGDTRTVAWLLDRRIIELAQVDVLVEILCMRSETVMLTLLDAGLDPEIRCSFDRTLLMHAAEQGCTRVVSRLLAHEEGIDVNARDFWHKTALQTATGCLQREEVVMMLLADPRVDINSPDESRSTAPLQIAMSRCLVDVVAAIARDPRIRVPPLDGEDTWLHWAALYGCKNIISLFLADQRVNVNARNQAGLTAYMTAVHNVQRWSVYLLLEDKRVDRSLGPEPPSSPIHLAAMHGWPEVMRTLLADETVDVNSKHNGETPLHAAIRFRQSEIVGMLVDDPRVDVNLCYVDEPPLNLAAGIIPACREIVLLLLSRDDVDLGILNRGVPEGWDPSLQKMILRDVVGHAQSKTRRLWGGPCDGARAMPTNVMEQIRACRMCIPRQSGDGW